MSDETAAAATAPKASHVDSIDGLRGIAIIMVLLFHIWQLSWQTAAFKVFGVTVSVDFFQVTGFMGVELFFFLSGFCLFYPYARHELEGGRLQTVRQFYYKRAIKILPSYFLAMILTLSLSGILTSVDYSFANLGKVAWDIISHALFIHNLSTATYGTINGIFWSLAVEVQFYLIFPLLCLAFRKKPLIVFVIMSAASIIYRMVLLRYFPMTVTYTLNQLPGFLDMFAGGMLAAYGLVFIRSRMKGYERLKVFFTTISLLSFAAMMLMFMWLYRVRYEPEGIHIWQVQNRFLLSLIFVILTVSASLSFRAWQQILANRVLVFMSVISYNLYIWHQLVARELYIRKIPSSALANPRDDKLWQTLYTLTAIAAGITVATLITYIFEKPLLKYGVRGVLKRIGEFFSRKPKLKEI